MTTIKDFKKWLENFPEEAIVEIAIQQPGTNYESYGGLKFVSPKIERTDIDDGWEFMDFRNNKYVKKDSFHFGKCYLRLGESN
jgi:hypothetical protein